VCHYAHMYVGTSTCERMYMHMCVRVDPMQACALVFARAAGAATQPEVATSSYVSLCTYICGLCLSPYVYVREHIYSTCLRVCACAYVRVSASGAARTRATTRLTYICVCVSTYV
jgi:hypothetical protein